MRKGREKRKEENKEEKKEVAYTLRGRFFSYLGYPCLRAIQWPWILAPTWGLVQKQFGNKLCEFLGSFGSRKLDFGASWTC